MKPTFNLGNRWRATSALCVVSTLAIATASYGAEWGRSNWDKRSHSHHSDHNNNSGSDHHDGGNHGDDHGNASTASPIKHVIILIGENRGLDHTFGVYKPKGRGETISNLLSKGIVNEDGSPGPNFAKAQQFAVAAQPSFFIGAPTIAKSPYNATNITRCRSRTRPAPRPRRGTPPLRSIRLPRRASKRTWIRSTSAS